MTGQSAGFRKETRASVQVNLYDIMYEVRNAIKGM
jgi:hypothetical protein